MSFPEIDPVLIQFGPFAIRWYAIAYIAGILGGCYYATRINRYAPSLKDFKPFDDYFIWLVLGIIIGGRSGYVLFYNFSFYIEHPSEIIKLWKGGMSFHGGLAGVIFSTLLFCKKQKYPFLLFIDICSCAAPIGLFFGRIANFINGELYGRVTENTLFGVVFPTGGPFLRHPSQLYEAFLEGILLFLVLFFCISKTKIKHYPGMLSGIFLIGYSVSRFVVEFFREPDSNLGFIFSSFTMGQVLTIPMLLLGGYLLLRKKTYVA